MTGRVHKFNDVRHAFHLFVQMLRRAKGLTVDELAARTDIDRTEIIAMERSTSYKPSPLTLHRLSKFFKIPQEKLQTLVGATRPVPQDFHEEVSRFAAKSESFACLTKEEKRVLDEFVKFLRAKESNP